MICITLRGLCSPSGPLGRAPVWNFVKSSLTLASAQISLRVLGIKGQLLLQAEEEISSGHYPISNGARKGTSIDLARKNSPNAQQHQKEAAGVDELRELTSRGVCAPFWRTTQQTGPVRHWDQGPFRIRGPKVPG